MRSASDRRHHQALNRGAYAHARRLRRGPYRPH
uniref:Uncharacterized protein n=1 Tax=Arundo donax TaxID=35708 RepID=A0A0A8YEK5_ARUDO